MTDFNESDKTLEDDEPEGAAEIRALREVERLMASHAALQAACEEANSFLESTVAYGAARVDKWRVRKQLKAAIAGAIEVSR